MKIKITESGFVAGEYHEKGEVLEVTERQANTGVRRGRVEIVESGSGDGDTEKGRLKTKLDALGVPYRGNASVDTLKGLLAENDPTA